jgi:hypothetical protein
VERGGKDKGREGEAVGHRHDAGGKAGKQIFRLREEVAGYRASPAPGDTFYGHFG